jgi:Ni/Fe-hydrogenase 1 B-type cytochrome subunit
MKKNETSTIVGQSPFIQQHSASIRIWHWITFLTLTFILLTVLFASTLLNPRKNIPVVQNMLKEKGAVVDNDQAFAVAHIFDDKMWDLHKLLGFGLSFLLLARIGVELAQSDEEKIRSGMKNALTLFRQNDPNKKEIKHYLIVKGSYSLFYLLVIYMATTGLLLAFGRELGLSRPTNHLIKEIHGFGQYLIYAFVFFHLCGVIIADLGKSKGIVSGMINGGE